MNILIIQEAGRHARNFEFRESLNFQRAFSRLGHSCTVWGKNYPDFDKFNAFVNQADVLFLLENYETGGWIPDLSGYSKPKLFWSIDAHWNFKPHLETVEKHKITHVLSSTFAYCKEFKCKSSWFPNAYPADLIDSPTESKKLHNVGFCGNIVNRGEWIKFLMTNCQMKFDQMVLGPDMIDAIRSYRVHWNRNIKDDINYRTFETLGCGTFLLTNYTDRLSDLFDINSHFITYGSPQDCLNKIDYFLRREDEREEIAKKGHEHVKQWHTYDCRAKQFIDIVENRL